ncbi:MAG: FAD-dependent oxidoreductase [Candidatus Gastranaerophilales bacterium]|nr:FAD-dependent oxidoreductase [Candidatus Gastranaerophilales bacterium]
MNTTIIDSLQDGKRLSTKELLDLIYEKIDMGFNEFKIIASGQHDLGGPLWSKDGKPLLFHITNPGQRVGSMGMAGTKIIVTGSAPADIGWLNSGAEIVVLGDAGDTAAHCQASGKIYVAGRVGTRSGALMKHDPKFEEPEFWVLKNTGSFSFEFMGGGRAVVCGWECENMDSVLSNRSCCGMVGGVVYFRGNVGGLTNDVDVYELDEADKNFLKSGLIRFLNEINKGEIYEELTEFSLWKKILAKPYDKKIKKPPYSIKEFREQKWVKGGIFSEFFGNYTDVLDVINTGENRLRYPAWENNLKTPPCEFDCPVSIPTQKRIELLRQGQKEKALNLIYDYSPFPASVCGQVCPNLCMDNCTRGCVDEHIKVAPLGIKSFENVDIKIVQPSKNKRVAVIGGGVAGLSSAWTLSRNGYNVELFEKDEEIGGKLRQVIPFDRLNQETLNAELEIIKNSSIKINTNCNIDKDEFDRIKKEYDAVVVAIGAHNPAILPIEGKERLIKGLEFLKLINSGHKFQIGKNVVVIGAGNAAMDVITGAYKMGAKNVTAIDIQKPMAFDKEIEHAKSLGAKILYPCFTEKVTEQGVHLKDGTLIKADSVIISIGDRPIFDFIDEKYLNERKFPLMNEFNQSEKNKKIFFAGDCTGQGLFCNAIGKGREAAINIDNMLSKRDLKLFKTKEKIKTDEVKSAYYTTLKGSEIYASDALEETNRCMSCAVCRDCKMCMTACPKGAIERVEMGDEFAYISDAAKCIGCGMCAGVCPCGVWKMTSNLEEN